MVFRKDKDDQAAGVGSFQVCQNQVAMVEHRKFSVVLCY